MKKVGVALAALLLVSAPALVLAQDEGAGGPPGRTPKEPRRVLEQIVKIIEDSTKQDPKSTLAGLRDPSWAVRMFAAVRMKVLGLDDPTVRALRAASRPGSKAPAADDKNVAAAEAFAKTVKPAENPEAVKASVGDDAIRVYGSLVHTELSIGKASAAELKELLATLPDYAAAAEDPRAKSFVAREIVALTDEAAILKDLGAKDVNAAVAEDGKKVFDWFRSNEKYLYRHPRDGVFYLDVAARSDGTPSEKFREKRPWKDDEGPNAPPKKPRETK